MNAAKQRMVTIHMPEGHKAPKDRCSQQRPDCSMNHYFQVPVILRRGTWNFQDSAHIPGRN